MKFGDFLNQIHIKILEYTTSEQRIKYLRRQGVKIGQNCTINSLCFSTEPYLIEIGNHVAIANGTSFITHDGSVRCFHDEFEGGIYGKIKIGSNVVIGMNCIILYNTTIGDNCIIGAGSIVRGQFPDNSVIVGNPAKVVLNTNIQKILYRNNSGLLKTNNISASEKDKLVKKHFGVGQ
ncbi:MAG: acyltransferase [Bacteroidales bacterium]